MDRHRTFIGWIFLATACSSGNGSGIDGGNSLWESDLDIAPRDVYGDDAYGDDYGSECQPPPVAASDQPAEVIASDSTDDWWMTLVANDSHLFWQTYARLGNTETRYRVMMYSLSTQEVATIATARVSAMATFAGDEVFFLTSDGDLYKASTDKVNGELVAAYGADDGAMAIDADAVYLLDKGGFDCEGGGRVSAVSKVTAEIVDLVVGLDCPYALAVDDSYVYFSTRGADPTVLDGSIRRVPKNGGDVELIARAPIGESDLIVHGNDVMFFVDESADSIPPDRGLVRVPKAGGALEQLSSRCTLLMELASVDGGVIVGQGDSYTFWPDDGAAAQSFYVRDGYPDSFVVVGNDMFDIKGFAAELVRKPLPAF